MYEFQNISNDIRDKFYKSIFKTMQKKNWNDIVCLSLKSVLHEMLPNFQKHELEKYIKVLLKPILEAEKNNFIVREFIDDEERREVYESTYGGSIDELLNSEAVEDKHNLTLIHYIYDLLEYDKVLIIENKKYLYSYVYINAYAQTHLNAYKDLEISYANKPNNFNYDTATNKTKDKKSQLSFLNPMLKPAIQNKFADSTAEELKLDFIKNYETEHRMLARSIHELAKLKEHSDNFEINTIGSLEPYINSDGLITNHDIYISWYAYVFGIYKNDNIPITKKLKLAQLSSYVIFPKIRNNKELIINEKTAIKPIREIAMFKDLRLLDFTDNRTIITRTNDEIEFTEEYLIKVTKYLNKYS